ncbi:MAG: FmdB family zinc ribbon protein [Pseudoclavibacter sp.]
MPKYSYRCTACDNAFDIQQSFSDDSLTVCPECGGELRKLFGAVGIAFKGSGFYRNDHGAGAQKTSSGSTDTTSNGSGSSDTSTSSTSTDSTTKTPATAASGSGSTPTTSATA